MIRCTLCVAFGFAVYTVAARAETRPEQHRTRRESHDASPHVFACRILTRRADFFRIIGDTGTVSRHVVGSIVPQKKRKKSVGLYARTYFWPFFDPNRDV